MFINKYKQGCHRNLFKAKYQYRCHRRLRKMFPKISASFTA